MKLERAAVIGAGAMGSGIAQVLSQAGARVVLKDVKDEFVERGLKSIERMYDSRVKREALTRDQADECLKRIKPTVTYDDIGRLDPDIVIEAALEKIDVKLDVFKQLDSVTSSKAILATNTSALSISEIAAATSRPERVVGMHFFNPAQTMKLVEVIPGVRTEDKTVESAMRLLKDTLGKVPVRVKECPGFLVNRVLFPYMNEALYALVEGNTSIEEIDRKVVEFGLPMGPFTLYDMTGIDVCSHVVDFLYDEYGPRFKPNPLLSLMVEAGYLGQKTGSGFYMHDKEKGKEKTANPELAKLVEKARERCCSEKSARREFEAMRVILPMFSEATYALQEEVVTPTDVDVAMKFGCGLKRGLLSIAEEKGLDWCLEQLSDYQSDITERMRPSWLLKKLVRGGIHDFQALSREPAHV